MFLGQNLILMGIFFAIPLYLQIVQGFDALETGMRMLPVSVALLVTALLGVAPRPAASRRARSCAPASSLLLVAVAVLLGDDRAARSTRRRFAIAMAVLGVGMGLIVSQLGNVVQSAVEESDRSEAGGLQYTAQQLGASLGHGADRRDRDHRAGRRFAANVAADPSISQAQQEVSVRLEGELSFVDSATRRAARAGRGPARQARRTRSSTATPTRS